MSVTYPWYSSRESRKKRHAKTSARPTIPVTWKREKDERVGKGMFE